MFLFFGAGSIASGDLNFTSIPQVDLTSDAVSPMDSSTNDVNPFSTNLDFGISISDQQGQEASRRDEPEPATSENSGKKGGGPMKKRKKS